MTVTEFTERFIESNCLVRLWYEQGESTYTEVVKGDRPMMEHELFDSEYKDNEVVGVVDIFYIDSHYSEAINLVIKRK